MKQAEMPTRGKNQTLGRPGKKQWLFLAALLVCCAVFFSWAAYTYLPSAMNASRRQIVNDEYSALTAPLGGAGEITQTMALQGRIYGVVLNVATFDRVPHGTLHLRLYGPDGTLAASNDTDMTLLLDNTFHRFLFDAPVSGSGEGLYTLSITATPQTADDVLAFHKSEGPAQSYAQPDETLPHYDLAPFALAENGAADGGTLALQYVVRYAGTSVVRTFSLFAAMVTVLLLAAYLLLFVWQASWQAVFALSAAALGAVFLFLVPPFHGLGEQAALADATHYANVLLGTAGQDTPSALTVPENALFLFDEEQALDVFVWQDLWEGIPAESSTTLQTAAVQRGGISPVVLLPQILAVLLGRVLGLRPFTWLLLGRVLNLLLYCAIVLAALRRMPTAKPLLAAVALLPSCLGLAASFNGYSTAFAASLLLVATCVGYAGQKKTPGLPGMLLLITACVAATAGQPGALPLLLVLLAIPIGGGQSKAVWAGFAAVTVATSVLSALLPGGPAAPAAISSTGTSPPWLQTFLVGGLATASGNQNNWVFLLALLFLMLGLAASAPKQPPLSRRIRFVLAVAGGAMLLFTFAWGLASGHSVNALSLLPAVFFLLAAMRGPWLAFQRDVSRPLLFCLLIAVCLVQADFLILILKGGGV